MASTLKINRRTIQLLLLLIGLYSIPCDSDNPAIVKYTTQPPRSILRKARDGLFMKKDHEMTKENEKIREEHALSLPVEEQDGIRQQNLGSIMRVSKSKVAGLTLGATALTTIGVLGKVVHDQQTQLDELENNNNNPPGKNALDNNPNNTATPSSPGNTSNPVYLPQLPAKNQSSLFPDNTIPNTVPPTTPSTVFPTTPNTVPSTTPSTVFPTTPNTVPSTIPNTVPPTTPNTVPSTIPNTVPSTIPNTVPSTIPNTVPSTIPNTVPPPNSNRL